MNRVSLILAAGASTRMKSKTSKLLYPICGRSLIHWAVQQASVFSGTIVVVTGYQRNEVEQEIRRVASSELKINFAVQEPPLGTADAVKIGIALLNSYPADTDVFIMGADSVLLREETLKNFGQHHEKENTILSVLTAHIPEANPYGRIVRNAQSVIEKIVEVKDASPSVLALPEVNTGFYIVKLSALREALLSISNQNTAQEFYFTDILEIARKRGWLVQSFSIPKEEAWGVNTQEDLALARSHLQQRINHHWMREGVCLVNPSLTWIDADAQLSPDTKIEPGVSIFGKSVIGSGCHIKSWCILENTKVGEGVVIEPFTHVHDVQIKDHCHIGPFARLRPGTVLEPHVHIGNFVEVKKSHLEQKAKANHLSYIGDAFVGAGSNIGAGTITCNYDGIQKHQTKIGEGVFIGSNTSLVAPVEIEDGAIVGAGSVITKNVSKNALALERCEQKEVKEGATRFRQRKEDY